MAADEAQTLAVARTAAFAAAPAVGSGDPAAAGETALRAGNYAAAESDLLRAVAASPPPPEAWGDLGEAYLRQGKYQPALDALRRQLALNPYDAHAHDYAGYALLRLRRFADARNEFAAQLKINPLDAYAAADLGRLDMQMGDYQEAASALARAAQLSPKDFALELRLGATLERIGRFEDAAVAIQRASGQASTPAEWGEVGALMAGTRLNPDLAASWARRAADGIETELKEDAAQPTTADVRKTGQLAMNWGTLGLMAAPGVTTGDAEIGYEIAAWRLLQLPSLGRKLAGDLAASGRRARAIPVLAAVVAGESAMDVTPEFSARLAKIGVNPASFSAALAAERKQAAADRARLARWAGRAGVDEEVADHALDLQNFRTIRLPGHPKLNGEASLLVALAPAAPAPRGRAAPLRVSAVRWLGGAPELHPAAEHLRGLVTGLDAPSGFDGVIVLQGVLSCSYYSDAGGAGCLAVLLAPTSVQRFDFADQGGAPPKAG